MVNRILIFDTETTGVSKARSHIWQLTAVKMDLNDLPTENDLTIFDAHLTPPGYPDIDWDKRVEQYIKPSFDDLAKMHDPAKVFRLFVNEYLNRGDYGWHDRHIPICYNANFDTYFLRKYAKCLKSVPMLDEVLYKSYVDLFTLSVTYCRQFNIQTKSFKQFDICEALNVDVSDLEAHDAKDDIKASYRLMLKLIDLGVLWSYLKK